MLRWLRRRREAERLAQADAEALIRDHGGRAYIEARWRQRDAVSPDGTAYAGRTREHWRRVALIVAKRTGKRIGLDTATRMAMEADFRDDREAVRRSPAPDQIEELRRIIERRE